MVRADEAFDKGPNMANADPHRRPNRLGDFHKMAQITLVSLPIESGMKKENCTWHALRLLCPLSASISF